MTSQGRYRAKIGPGRTLASYLPHVTFVSILFWLQHILSTRLLSIYKNLTNFVSLSKTSIHPDTSRPITILPIQPQSFSFSPHHHQNGTSSLPGGQLRAAFIFPCLSSQLLTLSWLEKHWEGSCCSRREEEEEGCYQDEALGCDEASTWGESEGEDIVDLEMELGGKLFLLEYQCSLLMAR